MLETPPHALFAHVLAILIGSFAPFSANILRMISACQKTCQTAKRQVILKRHVTAPVLERPPATWEYGLTGFYIRASKAVRGRHEACEPSGWNIAVHVVRLCSSLKKLTVAATHTTSWKPQRPPTEFLVSPDAFGVVRKGIPEEPFPPTYDLGRNRVLCFVVSSVFRRFEPRPLWAPVRHRQDGPVWEQHQTPEAPAVPGVQRPEAAQPQQQQPAADRNRSEIQIYCK